MLTRPISTLRTVNGVLHIVYESWVEILKDKKLKAVSTKFPDSNKLVDTNGETVLLETKGKLCVDKLTKEKGEAKTADRKCVKSQKEQIVQSTSNGYFVYQKSNKMLFLLTMSNIIEAQIPSGSWTGVRSQTPSDTFLLTSSKETLSYGVQQNGELEQQNIPGKCLFSKSDLKFKTAVNGLTLVCHTCEEVKAADSCRVSIGVLDKGVLTESTEVGTVQSQGSIDQIWVTRGSSNGTNTFVSTDATILRMYNEVRPALQRTASRPGRSTTS